MINIFLFILLQQKPDMQVGVNLAPVNDYNREWVFLNIAKECREWHLILDGKVQPKPDNPIDINNFKFDVNNGLQTQILTNQDGHYPKGIYEVYFEGLGDVKLSSNEISRESFGLGTNIKVNIQGDNGLSIEVRKAPIKNLSVIWPNLSHLYGITPFHPLFVKDLRRFKYIRFLNWMKTNEVKEPRLWSLRTLPTDRQSYTQDGVALEFMIELCNESHLDAWFCLPHLYDEDYMRNFAKLVRDTLKPDLKVYLEFSNETWNDIFPQHDWAVKKAQEQNLSWPDVVADESRKAWDIWVSVFGDQSYRIVRVIGGNAASTWPIERMLTRWGDYKPDMIAIAAYFGLTKDQTKNMVSSVSAQQILDLASGNIEIRTGFIEAHSKICGQIPLGIYEGGQGILGKPDWYQQVFDAQLLPGMYNATKDMINDAKNLGCKTFGIFQYSGDRTDQHGSWGYLEWQDQAFLTDDKLRQQCPKMSAVRDFIYGR